MEESIPIEYETVQNEELLADKQQSRRMITETGDIIEAPLTENEDKGISPYLVDYFYNSYY